MRKFHTVNFGIESAFSGGLSPVSSPLIKYAGLIYKELVERLMGGFMESVKAYSRILFLWSDKEPCNFKQQQNH